MSKIDQFTAPYHTLPFTDLQISDLNPRAIVSDEAIARLAENIRACGLIHPLAGVKTTEGKVEIVAGGRRLRALALCQDDARFQMVPVHIAPDEDTARAWASAENANREALHPADEIRDYGNLAAKGADVAAIATAYGVTEAHVYRRLSLATLPAPVLDALRTDEINLSTAAAFTISNDEKRSLDVLEQIKGTSTSAHRIKSMLKPDSVDITDRRATFVGLDAYTEAGGRVTRDLFSDEVRLDDPDLLATCFIENLKDAATEAESEGWAWADAAEGAYIGYYEIQELKAERIYPTEGELTEEQGARYDELDQIEARTDEEDAELAALQSILEGSFTDDQKANSGVLVYVGPQGHLNRIEGIILPEQKKAAIAAGVLRAAHSGADTDQPKSPISNALRDDLFRIKAGSEQHAALRDPDLLIDLLAYQLSHDLNYRAPFAIQPGSVTTTPSTDADGYNLNEALPDAPRAMWETKDFAASFRAFRKKGADHIKGELVRHLASLYRGGDEKLSDLVAKTTSPDVREVWTPTKANFFMRVNGAYMVSLWADLLGLTDDHPTVTTFMKLKKAEKADKLHSLFNDPDAPALYDLSEAQTARLKSWLPDPIA